MELESEIWRTVSNKSMLITRHEISAIYKRDTAKQNQIVLIKMSWKKVVNFCVSLEIVSMLIAVTTASSLGEQCVQPKRKPEKNLRQWDPWQFAGEQCGCFNNVYVRRPKQIDECQPKEKYLTQIEQNFGNIELSLQKNGATYKCDFTLFRKRLAEMKLLAQQLVDSFFTCNEVDCLPEIMKANDNYIAYRSNEFNPFTYCGYTNYKPDCAQLIMDSRIPAHNTFENIMVGLLWCARAKLELGINTIPITTTTPPVLPPNSEIECNCVKVDPRPIPQSKRECFSHEFIEKLRKFVSVNFDRVYSTFDTNSSDCNYSEFYGKLHTFEMATLETIKIFEKCIPTMVDVDAGFQRYFDLIRIYAPPVREYIVNNDRSCYFNLTKSRSNPLSIADAVLGILINCVGYVDSSQDTCSRFRI